MLHYDDEKDWQNDEDGWWFYSGTNYKPSKEEIERQKKNSC